MSRVLHLRSSCGLYGADRALLDLVAATGAPFDPAIGSIVRPGRTDELGDEAKRRGLPLLRVESRGRVDFDSAKLLAARVVAEGISILHAHDYKSLSLSAIVSARTGIPVVATFHGDTAASPALRAYEALARVLGNLTYGVAAVSAPLARRLRRWVLTAPIHHIPNGIRARERCSDSERAQARAAFGLSETQPVIAVVGRLSPEKGHRFLLEAARRMRTRPTLLVAGDGELRAALEAQGAGLDVRWLGFVSEPRQLYAAAELVAMPSLTEGLPLVALEAMASGTPLVASNVGELPTLLRDGAGALVTPGDAAKLADALDRGLSDDALRSLWAERALSRVRQDYTLEAMADRYARQLYAPALGRRLKGFTAGTAAAS